MTATTIDIWQMARGVHPQALGFLPEIIVGSDPRPVKDQLNDRYAHGGGFGQSPGKWTYEPADDHGEATLQFTSEQSGESDDALRELARIQINDELVIIFDYSFMAIIQKDGTFAVTNVD